MRTIIAAKAILKAIVNFVSLFKSEDESLLLLVVLLNCDANQSSHFSFIIEL